MLYKINKEVKKNNSKKNKDLVMKEVRAFVKENVQLGQVEPTNLGLFKTLFDRVELKAKG